MDNLAFRVTPLTISDDIEPMVRHYRSLGFLPVETGDGGCVGMRAGTSHVILVSADFLKGDFSSKVVDRLAGKTIPYVHVRCLSTAILRLSTTSHVIEQVTTRGGTEEAVIEDNGHYQILAERPEMH